MGPTLGIEEIVLLDPSTLATWTSRTVQSKRYTSTGGGVVAHEFFRSRWSSPHPYANLQPRLERRFMPFVTAWDSGLARPVSSLRAPGRRIARG